MSNSSEFNDSPALTAREIEEDRAYASMPKMRGPDSGLGSRQRNFGNFVARYWAFSDRELFLVHSPDGSGYAHCDDQFSSFEEACAEAERRALEALAINVPHVTNSDPEAWNDYFHHTEQAIAEFKKGMKP